MRGIITDIQRFSLHDGPGIRTTVFLKGCNLRCFWCHNPETLKRSPQVQVYPERCIGCGACVTACSHDARQQLDGEILYDRARCVECGTCAATCYAEAVVVVGRTVTADEVVAELLRDRAFYETSGGGVTLSGGEPLLQKDFALAIFKACSEAGIHTALETNAAWPWERAAPLIRATDLVMMDLKTLNDRIHREVTGASNLIVRRNAVRIARLGKPLIVRTPVIPGVNDTESDMRKIGAFLAGLPGLLYYELLPYHPLGADKYRRLGIECGASALNPPQAKRMAALARSAREAGIPVKVGGLAGGD